MSRGSGSVRRTYPALDLTTRLMWGSAELWYDTLTSPSPLASFISSHVAVLARENLIAAKILQGLVARRLSDGGPDSGWLRGVLASVNKELLRHTDSVPYTDATQEYRAVKEWADARGWRVDDEQPAQAGTISLIFELHGDNGERYVAKVLRNGIRERLVESAEEVWPLAYAIAVFGGTGLDAARRGLASITDALVAQTDLETEAQQCRRFGEFGKHIDDLCVPQPVAVVDGSLIVFQRFDGVPCHGLSPNTPHRKTYIVAILKFIVISTLMHGVTHGDLHSGNVLFNEETGIVGVIDFGLVYSAPPEIQARVTAAIDVLVDEDRPIDLFRVFASIWVHALLVPTETVDTMEKSDYESLLEDLTVLFRQSVSDWDLGLSMPRRFWDRVRQTPGWEEVNVCDYGMQIWHTILSARAMLMTLCEDDPGRLLGTFESTISTLLHLDLIED
jgi:hypothetical protein